MPNISETSVSDISLSPAWSVMIFLFLCLVHRSWSSYVPKSEFGSGRSSDEGQMGLAYRFRSAGRTIAANEFDTAPVLRQFVDNGRPIPVAVTWPPRPRGFAGGLLRTSSSYTRNCSGPGEC